MVRLGELVMILELHREGVSVSDIARRVGLDRKTVRKYIARGLEPPVYSPRPPRPLLIDGFASYLRERVAACKFASNSDPLRGSFRVQT